MSVKILISWPRFISIWVDSVHLTSDYTAREIRLSLYHIPSMNRRTDCQYV